MPTYRQHSARAARPAKATIGVIVGRSLSGWQILIETKEAAAGCGFLRVWSSGVEQPAFSPLTQQELLMDLHTLRDKICSLVPSVRKGSITLHFVGEDGKKEEYILKCTSQKSRERECRHGLRCRHCGNAITQCRYMCVSCPDYNLCGGCEAAGAHSEHIMLRISRLVRSKRANVQMKSWCEYMRSNGADDFFSCDGLDQSKSEKMKEVGIKQAQTQNTVNQEMSYNEKSATEMQIVRKSEPVSESEEDGTNLVPAESPTPENIDIKLENIKDESAAGELVKSEVVYNNSALTQDRTPDDIQIKVENIDDSESNELFKSEKDNTNSLMTKDPLPNDIEIKEEKIDIDETTVGNEIGNYFSGKVKTEVQEVDTEVFVDDSVEAQIFTHSSKTALIKPPSVWRNPGVSTAIVVNNKNISVITRNIGVCKPSRAKQGEDNLAVKRIKLTSEVQEIS